MSENLNNNENNQAKESVATVQKANVDSTTANTQSANLNTTPNMNYSNPQKPNIPPAYKPLSPWAYVGYNLLFSIPLIGFIMMIVFSFDDSNLNRRNYSRSFFCAMLIGIIISIVLMVIIFAVLGLSFTAISSGNYSAY